jgi:outer membrane protein
MHAHVDDQRVVIAAVVVITYATLHAASAAAAALSLQELAAQAETSSPLLRAADERTYAAEEGTRVASAGHFPALHLSQSLLGSNNPVEAFTAKLLERDFRASDFEIQSLNHPDFTVLNQTSASISLPLFLGGSVRAATRAAEAQRAALAEERRWIKKELIRNIYALYHSYWALSDLEAFLHGERDYLEHVVASYDAKTPENRNRFLSYNQALIILSSIDGGLAAAAQEKSKILTTLSFLTGAQVSELSPPGRDPLDDFDWQSTPRDTAEALLRREDLRAMEYQRDALEAEKDRSRATLIPGLVGFVQHDLNTEKWSRFAQDTTVGATLTWSFAVASLREVDLAGRNVAVANRELDEKKAQTRNELSTLRLDLERLSEALQQAERRHRLFAQNKELMTLQYQQGSVELYNMLDNFQHYLENYRGLLQTKSELRSLLVRYADNFREIL